MSSYRRARLQRQIEKIEERIAGTAQSTAEVSEAGRRMNVLLLARVRSVLGAIREGGNPLPWEITPQMEQDRATLARDRLPGEIEANAALFRQRVETIAQNQRMSQPLNEARLTTEPVMVTRDSAGPVIEPVTVERIAEPVADGNIERARRAGLLGPSDGSRIWNYGAIPRRGPGPHWVKWITGR